MHNKLRVRRAELDLSQHELARRLAKFDGLSRDRIHRIEREYAEPTEEEIAALARALDTTPDALFPGLAEQQNAGAR